MVNDSFFRKGFALKKERKKRIILNTVVFTGGGTVGHVILNTLLFDFFRADNFDIHYIGSKRA